MLNFEEKLLKINPKLKLIGKYINSSSPVIIEDELGILYNCRPSNLLQGKIPTLQSAINKTEAFKIKLKSVQPYLNITGEYVNIKTQISVLDNLGIEYLCFPEVLLSGRKPSISSAVNKQTAMSQIFKLHGFTLMSEYIDSFTKVIIKDKDGYEYFYYPKQLSNLKNLNIKSAVNKTLMFCQMSSKIHNSKYNYDKVNYSKSENELVIICPVHGEFKQRADLHLQGAGCFKCGHENHPGGMPSILSKDPEKMIYLYYMELENSDGKFYKIGLTIKEPKIRMQSLTKLISKKILEVQYGKIKDLYLMEQEYKKMFKEWGCSYQPLELKGNGATECFKW